MSTIRETVARLGELAGSLDMDWYDAEVVSRFLVSEDEKQPLLTAQFIESCSPVVISTLVKQMEWAATIIRTGFNCDEGCQCAARQWIAAFDKEL